MRGVQKVSSLTSECVTNAFDTLSMFSMKYDIIIALGYFLCDFMLAFDTKWISMKCKLLYNNNNNNNNTSICKAHNVSIRAESDFKGNDTARHL